MAQSALHSATTLMLTTEAPVLEPSVPSLGQQQLGMKVCLRLRTQLQAEKSAEARGSDFEVANYKTSHSANVRKGRKGLPKIGFAWSVPLRRT